MLAMMIHYDLCCGLNTLREVNSFGNSCSVEISTIAVLVECIELVYQVGICGEHGGSHLLLHSLLKLVLIMSHTLLLGRKLIGRLLKIFSYHEIFIS
ncbi:uncharacterized protein LOC127744858 isoform X1 [Arachis duranensis]|uniref:Uncharacterized protein LOC127744858 isoform X1 n=1 Tax=Arachis duranensis TaxID=130453 RepID=A0A9C6TRH1_ARADU|nr:uncharacterized protein LOC127744858 isoform X1 [Arachis duranensis]